MLLAEADHEQLLAELQRAPWGRPWPEVVEMLLRRPEAIERSGEPHYAVVIAAEAERLGINPRLQQAMATRVRRWRVQQGVDPLEELEQQAAQVRARRAAEPKCRTMPAPAPVDPAPVDPEPSPAVALLAPAPVDPAPVAPAVAPAPAPVPAEPAPAEEPAAEPEPGPAIALRQRMARAYDRWRAEQAEVA